MIANLGMLLHSLVIFLLFPQFPLLDFIGLAISH